MSQHHLAVLSGVTTQYFLCSNKDRSLKFSNLTSKSKSENEKLWYLKFKTDSPPFLCLLFYFLHLFPPGDVPPGKSIRHMRQFHSHHNLLSLAQPASRLHGQDLDTHDRRGPLGSALSFTLGSGGGGSSGSCSSLSGSTESSIWVRQTPQEDSKPSPATNFWDFFTGKGSGSETMV